MPCDDGAVCTDILTCIVSRLSLYNNIIEQLVLLQLDLHVTCVYIDLWSTYW